MAAKVAKRSVLIISVPNGFRTDMGQFQSLKTAVAKVDGHLFTKAEDDVELFEKMEQGLMAA